MVSRDDMTVRNTVTTGQRITMDKRWETQDHRKVRLMSIDTDMGDAFPVIGFVYSPRANGSEYLQRWSRHGAALYTEEDDTCNLIPVLTKHQAWAWVSDDGRVLGCCDRSREHMENHCEFNEHVELVTWED